MERLTSDSAGIARAAALLSQGEVVGFPTDTVYGLAAAPGLPASMERIYEIKGRPAELPLVLMIADTAHASRWAHVDDRARQLMARWWPGPLTLVLPATQDAVPPLAAGDPPTIGIRLPAHELAIALIRSAGGALATTSANRSGFPPALTADGLSALEGVAAVIDAGRARGGMASTVLDISHDEPRVLREGPISRARVLDWLVGSDA